MPLPELTRGFWQRFFNDERPEKPILQIMDGRPIQKTNAPPDDRYRFRISDGDFYYSTCLTQTQLSERIAKDKLNVGHSIIRLLDYNGSILNAGGKVTFCLGNYEILAKTAPLVGNPVAHSGNANDYPPPPPMSNGDDAQQSVSTTRPPMQPAAAPAAAQSNFGAIRDNNRPPVNQQQGRFQGGSRGGVLAGGSAGSQNITPISSVTPYASKWKICGIVTAKEDIRTIKTARGDTKVFNFEMVDQEGTDVRVGAWNELADKFHSMINKGQMYYLSGATVKQTNKRFNTTKHEYELSLRSDSEIVACIDRAQFAAPRIRFQFVKFNQLQSCIGTNVDVIGVVQSVDDVSSVPSKKTNETLNKRDVHLVDDSGTMVTLTLWGDQARNFTTNGQEHPVVALKGVSVREFRENVSLSMLGSTKMELSPDFPEAYDLSGWYDEQGSNIQQVVAMSRDNSAPRDGMWDMRVIGIADALQLGNLGEEKGAYFNLKAMIASMKTENALYKACAEEGCKKKVIEVNGMLRCEKCNKQSLNFKYVTLLSAEMTDFSGTHWVTMFEESAQKLLGKSAAELGTLLENDKDAYYAVFEKVRFNSFIFRIRSKAETYNDESRIKWTVYDVRPVPWDQYVDALNKTIEAIAAL